MAELVGDMFRGMPWYLFLVIILGFTWLLYTTANIPTFIERGAKIKASYGNAKIEIGKGKQNKDEVIRSENELQEDKEIQND